MWRRGVRDRQLLGAGAVLALLGAAVSGVALLAQGFEQLQNFWGQRYLCAESAGAWGVLAFHAVRDWV